MIQCIDKSDIVAEIERRIKEIDEFGTYLSPKGTLANLLCYINSIEMKGVDFIEEFYTFSEKQKLMDKDIEFSDIEKTASFFFQLGLKAQKGE